MRRDQGSAWATERVARRYERGYPGQTPPYDTWPSSLQLETLVMTEMDFALDLKEGEERLSGAALRHFRSRVEKAAHILEELTLLGVSPNVRLKALCAGAGLGFVPYILARHTAWTYIGGEL